MPCAVLPAGVYKESLMRAIPSFVPTGFVYAANRDQSSFSTNLTCRNPSWKYDASKSKLFSMVTPEGVIVMGAFLINYNPSSAGLRRNDYHRGRNQAGAHVCVCVCRYALYHVLSFFKQRVFRICTLAAWVVSYQIVIDCSCHKRYEARERGGRGTARFSLFRWKGGRCALVLKFVILRVHTPLLYCMYIFGIQFW